MARPQLPNPRASSENAQHTMRANRRRNTGPERALRAALSSTGVRGYRLDLRTAPGRPDIAFTRLKLAVFVHGCFWHRCPHCKLELPKQNRTFWKRKFELNAERDERKCRQLEAQGWEVLEFWECEVERDAVACAATVKRKLAALGSAVAADEEAADLRARRARKVRV